jgi:hypothetical protein
VEAGVEPPAARPFNEKPMVTSDISPEQRRKNIRLAVVLAVLVLFMFVTAIPFWQGLYNMVMGSIP